MDTLQRMPLLFVGHGSPMNAVEVNEDTETWRRLGESLPRPKAVLCLSAHFTARGSYVVAIREPETIHDFYGFPQELYDISYPAPGDPQLARRVQALFEGSMLTGEWGIDHGAWSVLRHLYPRADVPVVQISLNLSLRPEEQLRKGELLSPLREEGVLILGSGNVVHNLHRMANTDQPFPWAREFDQAVHDRMLALDREGLAGYRHLPGALQSVPTNEHFVPLLYVAGAAREGEAVRSFNRHALHGSLTMTGYQIG